MAEAKIMQFTGRRVRQPSQNTQAPAKVPSTAVTRLDPDKEALMRGWAEERMRDAIRQYRALFSSTELVMRLCRAADDELLLIEASR